MPLVFIEQFNAKNEMDNFDTNGSLLTNMSNNTMVFRRTIEFSFEFKVRVLCQWVCQLDSPFVCVCNRRTTVQTCPIKMKTVSKPKFLAIKVSLFSF